MSLKFLILDSYDEQGQRFLSKNKVTSAGELYRRMLITLVGEVHTDIVFPALASEDLPTRSKLSSYSAIFVTGANLCVFDDSPVVHKQKNLMAEILDLSVPCFGTCWGLQLAMVVAGGVVQKNPRGREIGIARKISLTDQGLTHPYFAGKPICFDGFTSHGDEVVTLAPNSQMLASNSHSMVQAAVIHAPRTKFFGLQYHPEYSVDIVTGLMRGRSSEMVSNGYADTEAEAIDFADRLARLMDEPSNRRLRYQMAVDDDVLDIRLRTMEVNNWLRCEVL